MSLVNMIDDNLSSIVYNLSSRVQLPYLVSFLYVILYGRVAASPRVWRRHSSYSEK
jgi:hypothetical protein